MPGTLPPPCGATAQPTLSGVGAARAARTPAEPEAPGATAFDGRASLAQRPRPPRVAGAGPAGLGAVCGRPDPAARGRRAPGGGVRRLPDTRPLDHQPVAAAGRRSGGRRPASPSAAHAARSRPSVAMDPADLAGRRRAGDPKGGLARRRPEALPDPRLPRPLAGVDLVHGGRPARREPVRRAHRSHRGARPRHRRPLVHAGPVRCRPRLGRQAGRSGPPAGDPRGPAVPHRAVPDGRRRPGRGRLRQHVGPSAAGRNGVRGRPPARRVAGRALREIYRTGPPADAEPENRVAPVLHLSPTGDGDVFRLPPLHPLWMAILGEYSGTNAAAACPRPGVLRVCSSAACRCWRSS